MQLRDQPAEPFGAAQVGIGAECTNELSQNVKRFEEPFRPARRAHPALVVDDLDGVAASVTAAGFEVDDRERETFEGYLRFHTQDGAGNRIEVLQALPTEDS